MAPFSFQLWVHHRKIDVGVLSRPKKGVARPNAPYMRDRHAMQWLDIWRKGWRRMPGLAMLSSDWLHSRYQDMYKDFTGYFKIIFQVYFIPNFIPHTSVWALMIVETILTQFPQHWRSANQRMESAVCPSLVSLNSNYGLMVLHVPILARSAPFELMR